MRLLIGPAWKTTLSIFGSFAAVGVLGAGLMLASGKPSGDAVLVVINTSLFGPAVYAANLLATLVHELGHVLAARLIGSEILQIQVEDIVLAFKGEPVSHCERFAGSVTIQNTLESDRPVPATFISLSGPILELLVGLSALIYLRHLTGAAQLFVASFVIFCLYGAYRSLNPHASKGSTDIKHVLDYWKPEPQIFAQRSLHRVWPILHGEDPTTFHPEDIRRALTHAQYRPFTAQIATYHAMAHRSGDVVERAEEFLRRSIEDLARAKDEHQSRFEEIRQEATLELAFCHAFFRRDAAASRTIADELTEMAATAWPTARRLFAAQVLVEGDIEAAKNLVARYQILLEEGEKPVWAAQKSLLRMVELECQTPTAKP